MRNTFPCGSSYYLLVLELELPGLAGRLGAVLDGLELSLCLGGAVVPEVPPAPDVLELPEADVPPPEAARFPSRSHPATKALLSANATAAANAVNFMLTSMVVCPNGSK
jgi:hypothetical protein